MQYFARKYTDKNGQLCFQTAKEHCVNVAEFASERLLCVGLDRVASLAGLLHDMGKFKEEFQKYLLEDEGVRGSVIHTFAGAKFILDRFRKEHYEDNGPDAEDLTAEFIAYAIAAHHGQFDLQNSSGKSGFAHRRNAEHIFYEESCKAFFAECISQNEIIQMFYEAAKQMETVLEKIKCLPENDEYEDDEIAFLCSLLQRLILSAVIDADRTDAANKVRKETKFLPDWNNCLKRIEEQLAQFPCVKPIDRVRRDISEQCFSFAERPGGILRLNVPTGGGKTLSSLRYAVAHAACFDKRRVIFTAPMLTIIEQNAEEIKKIVGDEMVLEHHSNVVLHNTSSEMLDKYEELSTKWDAPIIITSMTQLLNTFFSGKTSSIRRFQSLCNSVIIIDEVQAIPTNLLSLFNLTISFLAEIAGATIVLCSATQPRLKYIEHTFSATPRDIVKISDTEMRVFKRTAILDAGTMLLDEVAIFAKHTLEEINSLLIVCNKKSQAERLFAQMSTEFAKCFHLSASMCADHRRKVLKSIYACLEKKEKIVCVSTQVIEAGVNISFESVIRLAAGMDSIVQSAGRCNRHAENGVSASVYVVRVIDENLTMLKEIKRGKDATVSLLEQFSKSPELFDDELVSDKAVDCYYRELYRNLDRSATEYPLASDTIFNLLGRNTHYCNPDEQYYLQQAFKTAGDAFEVFDNNCIDVIVPFGRGKRLIEDLQSNRAKSDPSFLQECIQKSAGVSVSVYDYQKRQLEKTNGLYWICDGRVAVLEDAYYDLNTGLTLNTKNLDFLEV